MRAIDLPQMSKSQLELAGLPYINIADGNNHVNYVSVPDGWNSATTYPGHNSDEVPPNAVRIGQGRVHHGDPIYIVYAWQGDRNWKQPGANLPELPECLRRRPGRPATRGPLTRLDTNIRADVAAVLNQIADTTGVPKAQLIERAVITAWPEHFDHD
jgi:hypothetical protein